MVWHAREPPPGSIATPLEAVAQAAAARRLAETDEDARIAVSPRATHARDNRGDEVADSAPRDHRGGKHAARREVRTQLRGDTLKKVERARRHVRDAEAAYHAAIGRAVRLGLSTRDIAHAADVTHGTIRAITARSDGGENRCGCRQRPTTATPLSPPDCIAGARPPNHVLVVICCPPVR